MICNTYTMEEVLDVILDYRGKTPKRSKSGIPTLSAKSVKKGYIDYSSCYYISQNEYDSFMNRGLPQKGDILLTTEAPLGIAAKLDRNGVAVAQRLLVLRGKKNIIDNDYLLYFLQSPKGQALLQMRESGTTVTGIKQSEFRKIEITIPDLDTQRKTISILSNLDGKICTNRQINDNLTQQIKLISDKWLKKYISLYNDHSVDVEMIPLSQIANFYNGYSYKSKELQKSDIAMLTIKNFDRKGGFKTEGYKEIVPLKKLKNTQFAKPFDIFVAHTDLTQNAEVIGNAELLIGPMKHKSIIFSMDLVKVTPKDNRISKFLLAAILQNHRFKEHCFGYINGTTVLHLSKKALSDYQIILPRNLSDTVPLNSVIESMYRQISANLSENIYLENIRNYLLLKIMSKEFE